jgi:hypothetical protein
MNRSDKGRSTTVAGKQKAGEGKQPILKGLERRRKSSRRVEARRNKDTGKDNKPVSKTAREYSLADGAAGQLAELYNELFDAFSTIEAVTVDSSCIVARREALAAMKQMLNILHRQEGRVRRLTEMEQECQTGAVRLEVSRKIAETYREFLAEFASDHWIDVVMQTKTIK